MSPTTNALIDYWHRLPAESHAIRRLNLAALCDEVRAGRRPPEVLLTVAIGDTDADIVHDATLAFLEGCGSGQTGPRAVAIDAALEWVSRGLALNRGAVFAVLLGSGDAGVLDRLAPQRLTLSEEEVATVCARLPTTPARSIVSFLQAWNELVEGSADPSLTRHRALIAGVLARCEAAIGPLAVA